MKKLQVLAALAATSVLMAVAGTASAVPLTLVADNSRNTAGALSFHAFKICAPASGNGCYATTGSSPGATWFIANGIVGSTATWNWDGATLAASGVFQSTWFISSLGLASSVISDKTIDLTINTGTMTTTAVSYNCVEGTFLSAVDINGCLNTSEGGNWVNDSFAVYNVGGNAACVNRTVGGDDSSSGNPRGLTSIAAGGSCDATDGAYGLWTIVSDTTGIGGQLILANQANIGNCSTVNCIDATAARAHYLTFNAVVPIPAAVWLFGSALGVMGWMRRKISGTTGARQ